MQLRKLVVLAAMALVALALPSTALAISPTPAPLPGSDFQGGDGDQDDPDGPGGLRDWQSISAQVVTNPDDDLADTAFAGGSKETEPIDWDFETVAGGVTPGKTNILAAWSYTDQTTDDTFLYLAFKREDSTGNTFLTFELNQRTDTWVNANGETIPCRTDGDVLVSYEVASGGSPPNVDVHV
jgi:hypothetical protein